MTVQLSHVFFGIPLYESLFTPQNRPRNLEEATRMTEHSSIDADEMAFYERLSALWWTENGPFWPLHRLNGLRVAWVRDTLVEAFGLDRNQTQPLKGLRILDIGCGGGILSEAVARLGADVHGVDVVSKNIQAARLHAADSGLNIRYEVASAEILAGRGELYDVVLNMEVVEHVAELDFFLNACVRLVRPDGVMVVATINRTLVSWLSAIVMAEQVLRWLPRGTHRWSRFPTPLEVENLLASGQLQVFAYTGVAANPFTRRFRLTGYMGINYMLAARKTAE
jgi:2-polyprenyl-6-hydroxyphenyl methylase/3-demethylubiquinone-9 3-methyltransferase